MSRLVIDIAGSREGALRGLSRMMGNYHVRFLGGVWTGNRPVGRQRLPPTRRVGVDLAKDVFHVHGVDRNEKPVWHRRLTRGRWLKTLLEKVEPGCEIGMGACAGAHHWARELQARGYTVKLIAPQFVKPYVKSNKNDHNDAEAICEAMSRPTMRFVEVKSVEQQDIQAVHRVRSELVDQRTAKGNQIRGLVAEYGLVAPKHLSKLRAVLPDWLEDSENGLTERFRRLLAGLQGDLVELDRRVAQLDAEIEAMAKSDPVAQRLQQLRGVGPMTATALVATVGSGEQFAKGRDFAVSLGLTPKQHSTGGKERLLGISKRGDSYLRKLLVHGARSVISHAQNKDDPLSRWVLSLVARSHTNVASVALANKTARIAWAMIRNGTDYQEELAASPVA
jgi:transposase